MARSKHRIEMGHKLMRMSYSSIIRESEISARSPTPRQPALRMQDEHAAAVGPIPGYIRGIKKELQARGETISPGDVIMHNDPYAAPRTAGRRLLHPRVPRERSSAFRSRPRTISTSRAHAAARHRQRRRCVCGRLQFKAIKVVEEGRKNTRLAHFAANIRAPELVVGDMEAQIKAPRSAPSAFGAGRQYVWRRSTSPIRICGLFRTADARRHPRPSGRRLCAQRRSTAISTMRIRQARPAHQATLTVEGDSIVVDLTARRRRFQTGRSTCRSSAPSIAPSG